MKDFPFFFNDHIPCVPQNNWLCVAMADTCKMIKLSLFLDKNYVQINTQNLINARIPYDYFFLNFGCLFVENSPFRVSRRESQEYLQLNTLI